MNRSLFPSASVVILVLAGCTLLGGCGPEQEVILNPAQAQSHQQQIAPMEQMMQIQGNALQRPVGNTQQEPAQPDGSE